jgi:hypothetical protein
MLNVKTTTKGDILTIEINLKERHGKSGSGKNEIIASTQGNQSIDGAGGVKIGLNVYCPVK